MRLPTLLLGALLVVAACRSAPPQAPVSSDSVVTHTDASAQTALTDIKLGAIDRGWRISDEGPDFVIVDFGLATTPLPGQSGRDPPRFTKVQGSGLFHARPAADGAEIALLSVVSYWHPDERSWRPAPAGCSPGRELLPSDAR